MKREEILKIIVGLSHSQGCYGRLLQDLQSAGKAEREETLSMLENQHFNNAAELCLYIEQAIGRI